MIGIVVVSHGKLARELVAATEHVVGEQDRFRSISIEVEDDIEARRDQIRETAKSCDAGKGVIILTDMFGGTPSNLAMSVMNAGNVEVLSGVNLPMLIKLAEVRGEMTLKDAAKVAAEAGRKYINIASELPREIKLMPDTETLTASQRAMIVNRKGLHARASARLSRLAGEFQSRIIVSHEGETADARSIMDLMMLVAHKGCEVDINAEGPDAAEAVTAIASLIADGFGEQGEADTIC